MQGLKGDLRSSIKEVVGDNLLQEFDKRIRNNLNVDQPPVETLKIVTPDAA